MHLLHDINAFLYSFRVWVHTERKRPVTALYICRIPHNMQDYKDKAYVSSFSKWPEDIFLLFNTLECTDTLSDTLTDILPDKTD